MQSEIYMSPCLSVLLRFVIIKMNKFLLSFSLFLFTLLLLAFQNCSALDNTTVTATQYITDRQTLTSSGEIFKLGFFSPINSSNRYIGIWYNKIPEKPIVWVANRNNPLKDPSGVLRIAADGNLVILDGSGITRWTTNVSIIAANNSVAEILDSGNLVLRQASDAKTILWQSFDNPTDTLLPTMTMGGGRRTGKNQLLTSWKSENDPATGIFSTGVELTDLPQMVIWKGSQHYWRSAPWNSRIFIGTPKMDIVITDGFNMIRNDEDDGWHVSFSYDKFNNSTIIRQGLNHLGVSFAENWDEKENKWLQRWSTTDNGECDTYSKCGPFGVCNKISSPICSCLRGFDPKSIDEWTRGNWSGGCTRKKELWCERNNTNTSFVNEVEKRADGFVKQEMAKVPDFHNWLRHSLSDQACEQECVRNCSCLAYSYVNGIGCLTWGGNLVDIQKFSQGGVDLYIRVDRSELEEKKNLKVIIIITVLVGTLTISVCTYFCWRWMTKQRAKSGKQMKDMDVSPIFINVSKDPSYPNVLGDNTDLKIFNFEELTVATNNFCGGNKLGEGGFGSVYKGSLTDTGQEIAVKRLSRGSSQGSEEFKNEVLVISKLQHRNLVRLFGCCIDGEEKMLIYEYMPNKSLDTFLFDPTKRALLDWRKRFQIIEGISRGVMYLHRDSRLKVIHRDLKASNVLLDGDLNPKISDFGMARIFGGNEIQEKTRRVVGTYGYMSPEYAMEGRFSEKSDVFSFGVLLIEIVSGKRNSSFYHEELSLSLLGYAWKLWTENMTKSLIDPTLLGEQLFQVEILRCIHVGLLCVQEFVKDRPTMSTTLSMLTSEITTLPTPKQPAFSDRGSSSDSNSFHKKHRSGSINTVTITSLQGR